MFKIISEKKFKTSIWSGGTTTQLFIYPENELYENRNFLFRLSIATTKNEFSNFTKLESITRFISILQGNMKISHNEKQTKTLNPYDIYKFQGNLQTSSCGKAKDFNLMLKNCDGNLNFKEIDSNFLIKFDNSDFIFIYCISGYTIINNNIIKENELLITESNNIYIKTTQVSKIFYGYIKKGNI